MLISSPFDTLCHNCKQRIDKGNRISYDKKARTISHAKCSEEGVRVAAAVERSKAVDAPGRDFRAPKGLEYRPYQKAGIEFLLEHNALLADEPGLGKTIQVIGLLNNLPQAPSWSDVLIVCPESLTTNWKIEINRWWIRDNTKRIKVINYNSLNKVSLEKKFDIVVFDEGQYLKNPKSQRAKLARSIAKNSDRVIILTGTPIDNCPIEIFPLLQMIDAEIWDPAGILKGKKVPAGEGAGFFRFAKRYCDAQQKIVGTFVNPQTGEKTYKKIWDIKGASNLPELQEKLRATVMMRRLKKDVLKELPPKIRQLIVLPALSTKDGELLDWPDEPETMPQNLEEILERLHTDLPAFEEFSRVRHQQALRKVPFVADFVRNALEASEKIILFGHHIDVLASLASSLAEFHPATLTGGTLSEDRAGAVYRFQNAPTCRLFIGSIKAAGVGLTLTASSHIVFAEGNYSPSVVTQAEDRADRIGQRNSVLIQHIIQDGTLDAHMIKLVVQKQEIINLALDTETM